MGVFEPDERARVADALERAVPGSVALGAVAYVEGLLTAFDHDPPRIWAAPNGGWLPVGPWEAHAWRTRIDAWRAVYARVGSGAASDDDFAAVHQHACEAAYGDPVYGGNHDSQGWVRIGFPTPQYRPGTFRRRGVFGRPPWGERSEGPHVAEEGGPAGARPGI